LQRDVKLLDLCPNRYFGVMVGRNFQEMGKVQNPNTPVLNIELSFTGVNLDLKANKLKAESCGFCKQCKNKL